MTSIHSKCSSHQWLPDDFQVKTHQDGNLSIASGKLNNCMSLKQTAPTKNIPRGWNHQVKSRHHISDFGARGFFWGKDPDGGFRSFFGLHLRKQMEAEGIYLVKASKSKIGLMLQKSGKLTRFFLVNMYPIIYEVLAPSKRWLFGISSNLLQSSKFETSKMDAV